MNNQKSIDDTCVHEWIPHPEIAINGLALQCKHCKEWDYKHPELERESSNTLKLKS